MAKNAHLVLDERATIEVRLRERASFSEIGRELGKDPSTISKEVRLHSQTVRKASFNPCSNRSVCNEYGTACSKCKIQYSNSCKRCARVKCFEHCKQFEELKRVDAIVSPLVKLGQSIHMICVNNADDIMLDEKTIYNYIDAGLLSVDNIDLPRKVRYRTRSHKKPVRVDKQCHVGRTYEDFEAYIAANPDIPVVEMDSVEGRKGGKVLLTIYFRNSSLMLAFIRDNNTAKSVTEIFEWLYEQLGHEAFTNLFQVILTDRGSEFTNPLAIEFNKDNERRTHIFYCDPQRSDQKGGCEVTHEMIRRVLPKKTSFDNLTQDDITLMMSHINSYNRKKLNNQSAHQLFSFINGGDILDKLGIKSIPANEINLTPLLLKK